MSGTRFLLKLPDAVIAATAITSQAALITADSHFARVSGLELVEPA